MKNKDIESILRYSRPQVQDNPTFLLEVRQKMQAVEGIKNEVDRQRRFGRTALILTLAAGLILGASAMFLAYLYPVDTYAIGDDVIADIRVFLYTYRQYLMLPIAGCAISLGLVLTTQKV